MPRVGLLGGMFDPIHVGHIWLARAALEQLNLDSVLVVPAADPPHKTTRPDTATAEDRWAMVRIALCDFPGLIPCRVELDRPGTSYTVDTLEQLLEDAPERELFLIIGADNVSQMHTWHRPTRILELCTVVAGNRPTRAPAPDDAMAARVTTIETPVLDVSSTHIRARLRQSLPVRYLLPPGVEEHIRQRRLYGAAPG